MDLDQEGEKLHQYLQGQGYASWHPMVNRFYDEYQRVWRVPTEGRTVGSAAIRITIFNDKSEQVFADGKTMELIKDETKISLSFPQLPSGSYFIIIDALDRTTGGKDVYSGAIRL